MRLTGLTGDSAAQSQGPACSPTPVCTRRAGDLYKCLDVRLTGVARGTAPHTRDGALAALHLADLALWLAPRAPFVRELRMCLPGLAPTAPVIGVLPSVLRP